jgi:hypothetical protein
MAAAIIMAYVHPSMAETLMVPVGKSELLRLSRAASVVMVGEPTVADVQVESSRLVLVVGKAVGETNLILLDSDHGEIGRYDILVVPETGRHVTIYHGGDGVSTMSCNPRCAGVKNPGTDPEPKRDGGGGGAAAAPVPSAAPLGGAMAPTTLPPAGAQGSGAPSLAPGSTVEQGASSGAGRRGY